ncbi:MFS transporter [Streptosporangium sp. NBC_01756]|uniref:MFS transporter n=1 Tax=Streptosporangium sp. NBC_01756 TaxID=2975950 RepID=UPI002DDC6BF7|nr:MFS transporter [Streptosporangium sp. NBC_01756]WSC84165.1 MFS transporter [Streptosporangium sp. NBC_01756]
MTVIDEKPPALWRNRNFVLLWIGSAASVMGSRVSGIALPLLVLALTGSPVQAGWVAFAGMLPDLLLYLPAGPLVDRWDWRRVMVLSELGRGLAVCALVISLVFGTPGIALIIAVAFVEGALGVFYRLAERLSVPSVVPEGQVAGALAANETRMNSALLLGRSLGGFLFGLGRAVPFVVDALSFAVSFGTLVSMWGTTRRPTRERRHILREMIEGLSWVGRDPFLRADLVVTVGVGICVHALILTFLAGAQQHGVSPFLIGVTLSMPGIGGVIGALVAAPIFRRFGFSVTLAQTWIWAGALAFPLLGVDVLPVTGALLVTGFIGSVGNVSMNMYLVRQAPAHMLGRVSGVALMALFVGNAVGPLYGGFLAEHLGVDAVAPILFAGMVLLAVWATTVPAIRRPPAFTTGSTA